MKGSTKTKLDEMAYRRDGFKCVSCGRCDGIEAHHKIPEVERLDNLVTLCHACHKKEHDYSGCFKHGHDSRRTKGLSKIRKINKTHFFNRHSGKWELIKSLPASTPTKE